jgi:hypothetical protein
MTYDSTADTHAHIALVQERLQQFVSELTIRAAHHDESKLAEPEKSGYDALGELIVGKEYGSPAYNVVMLDPRVRGAIAHHKANNSHHPEAHTNGVNDMTLIDLVEMFCDWKAASERSSGKPLADSLAMTCGRWDISPQLAAIFENTRLALDW